MSPSKGKPMNDYCVEWRKDGPGGPWRVYTAGLSETAAVELAAGLQGLGAEARVVPELKHQAVGRICVPS